MLAKAAADVLFDGSVIALVAAAATVVLDLFGFVNLSVPAAFALGSAGAYAFAAASAPEWQWIAAGALTGAIGGAIFDRLALRTLRERGRRAAMLPAGIAACLIGFGALRGAFGHAANALPHASAFARVATIGTVTFSALQATSVVLCIVLTVLLDTAVRKTRFGNGVRAAAENPLAALLMGMRVDRVEAAAIAATSALAAVAGALWSVHAGAMQFEMPVLLVSYTFAAVALARVGSIGGACMAAFAIVAAGRLAALYPGTLSHLFPLGLTAVVFAALGWRAWRGRDFVSRPDSAALASTTSGSDR